MSKRVAVWLWAVALVAALAAAPLQRAGQVLAASATLPVATPLRDAPTADATVIVLLPEGSVVSIDGPPVDGFYPVTAGDTSGWLPGDGLLVAKDEAVADSPSADPTFEGSESAVPGEQPAPDPPAGAAADLAATANDPAAVPASDTGVPVAPVTGAPSETSASSLDASGSDIAPAPDAPPVGAGDPELAPEIVGATPVPLDAIAGIPALDVAVAAPTPVVEPSLIAFPDPGPRGPASVTAETPILLGPGADYGVIAAAPAGSVVEQTGHLIGGYVTVRFAEITGWVAVDHLTPPPAAVAAGVPGG